MIKRVGYQWTTIQCKNLKSDDGELCDLCFKVLNDRFALTQQCPYCLGKIDLRSEVILKSLQDGKTNAAEKTELSKSIDAGTLLWKES